MSCSARLPVYAIFVGVFFEKYQSLVVLSLYVLGIVVALIVSTLLNKFILKSENSVFIVELLHIECHQLKRYGEVLGKKQKDLLKSRYIYFWWFCSHLGIELHRSSWGECTD